MNNYRSSNYSSFSRYGHPSRNPYTRPSAPKSDVPPAPEMTSDTPLESCEKCNLGCDYNGCYRSDNDCGMGNDTISPKPYDQLTGLPLAMAYVPWQNWSKPLCSKEGLQNGSIFPDLILPFTGNCACNISNSQRGGRR